MVGNENGLQISGIGQVSLPTTDIKLNNVLVVPDIKKKLLSVSQLTKEHNCYFIFYFWGFLLKDMRTKQVLWLMACMQSNYDNIQNLQLACYQQKYLAACGMLDWDILNLEFFSFYVYHL